MVCCEMLYVCCFVFICLLIDIRAAKQISLYTSHMDQLTTYEELYDLGMEAYRHEKWAKCSKFFERAIDDFHFYKNAVIDCRLKCKGDNLYEDGNEDLAVLHGFLIQSNCLRRCKKRRLNNRPLEPASQSTDQKFENRQPYNYLQFCYFKEERYKEALAAAYTYYVSHPDDDKTVESLQYYRDVADLTAAELVDLERTDFQQAYMSGLHAYNEDNWGVAAEWFEDALLHYYIEEGRCRTDCEYPYRHSTFPDFVNAIADHYIVVIVCQQRCLRKLSTFGLDAQDDFVAEVYNYLQFAYYNSKQIKKAVRAAASFLLFKPSDVEMLNNRNYYIDTLGYSVADFVPSEDAVRYVNYWRRVERSLDFVRETYALPNDESTDDGETEIDKPFTIQENTEEIILPENHYMKPFAEAGVKLIAESRRLNGPLRFAVDNFYKENQCQVLSELATTAARDKTGVRQVSVQDVIQLVKRDNTHEVALRLLLRSSEFIDSYTRSYFNQSLLWTQDIKVICRSGGSKWEQAIGEDCLPQEDGGCHGDALNPDYTALVYLSDIFDGTGHFYFLDKRHNVQSSVLPKCGRLLGYAGSSSHGVNLSWKTERCALVVHLSRVKADYRPLLTMAADFLTELEDTRTKDLESGDNVGLLQDFYSQGVTIVKSGAELHGTERFVADGLATSDECLELMEFARVGAILGHAYGSAKPHTPRETFSGLDIPNALEKGVLAGDGYITRMTTPTTPHTTNEIFAGLNISRALKLVESGEVAAHSLELFLDLSAMARLLVETFFNMTKPLYFEFTHLVVRTTSESAENKETEIDLSHPVHSDNCDLQDDGSCTMNHLGQRHYSALLYMNDDFEGGEFFFAHKNESEQISVQPKCGRLVAFNSSNYHGVKGVRSGRRCAIAMWYTHDPNYDEISQSQARIILRNIKKSNEKKLKKGRAKSEKKAEKKENSVVSPISDSDSTKELDLNEHPHLEKHTENENVDFIVVREIDSLSDSAMPGIPVSSDNGESPSDNEIDVESNNVMDTELIDDTISGSLPGEVDDENHDEL